MSTTVREPEKTKFTPAPEGLHRAVCVDVWDTWTEERPAQWGGGLVDKTRLIWQIDEINPEDGKPYGIAKKYTASLHEKANLRHDLESWRGRKFSEEELKGFDLDKVVGVCCQLQILHTTKKSVTYANIQSIMPLAKGQDKIVPSKDYVRKKDRKAEPGMDAEPIEDDDDSVPF